MLDKIRGTAVVAKEPGAITQWIGCSFIPLDTIKETCGDLLGKLKIEITIPGLLFIDSPGHEAFTSIRKRGSSIADLLILVIDITEGFQAQTDECIEFINEFKTPFVIAATKIDKTEGWNPQKDSCFIDSFNRQPEWVKENLEKLLYQLVGQLSERGFESERFDRVSDFKKTIAIIPVSGLTGEGIPELLTILSGIAQQFLKDELKIKSEIGYGSILEVKEVKGLGMTIDAILYDGAVKKGDWLIIGGKEPIVTKIKALLKPPALKEIRVEKQFESVDSVNAAAGIKISAPDLDKAIAGSPFACVHDENDLEKVKKELQEAVEKIEFETIGEGIILKADTLGSLEALIHILKQRGVAIKKAEVGKILRKDILEIEIVKEPLNRIIIAFNVGIDEDVEKDAKNRGIKILKSDIIYKLIEDYEKTTDEIREKIRKEKLESITRPARIKILAGMIFHHANPAIVGVEVLEGVIKPGFKLKKDKKEIGTIKAIQSENVSIEKAEKGQRVAVSIDEPIVGRHIFENDELTTVVSKKDIKVLEELGLKDEVELAREILE